jgi:hypothetical protein
VFARRFHSGAAAQFLSCASRRPRAGVWRFRRALAASLPSHVRVAGEHGARNVPDDAYDELIPRIRTSTLGIGVNHDLAGDGTSPTAPISVRSPLQSECTMNVTETALAWWGPVSSARPGGGEPFVYILGAFFASSIVWHTFQQRARTKQIRQFAERRSLTYIGATVPRRFPLHGTRAFQWARSIRRAVVGSNGRKELLLFDCNGGLRTREPPP